MKKIILKEKTKLSKILKNPDTSGLAYKKYGKSENIKDYEEDRDLLTFNNGNLVKFGLIDEEQNLLMDFESYTTTGYFNNNLILAFDYHKNENYLYHIISKEKIFAPKEVNDDEKTDYLKAYMNI